MKGLSPKPYQQVFLLALLVVLVTVAGIGIWRFIGSPGNPSESSATPVVNYFATYVAEGREFGHAYIEAPGGVFMSVNGIPVNYREYAVRKSQYASYLRNRDDGYGMISEFIDKYGVEAGALGSLIMDYALYSSAIEAGFGLSDSEMSEIFAGIRESDGHSPRQPDGRGEGYISVLGRDVYQNDIVMPRTLMVFAVHDWLDATVTGLNTPTAGNQTRKALGALHEEALSKAKIQILDDTDLNTTVEEALSFIRAYNATTYESGIID